MKFPQFGVLFIFILVCNEKVAGMVSINDMRSYTTNKQFTLNQKTEPVKENSALLQNAPSQDNLRMTKSKKEDMGRISTLLSEASIVDTNIISQWKSRMERLRQKDNLQKQLQQRHKAISLGETLMTHTKSHDSKVLNSILWAKIDFRTTVEAAANMSAESNIWKSQDFESKLKDSSYLQHVMITVKDQTSTDVIGFCEVAMLAAPPFPSSDLHEAQRFVPTIANLVVSPSHRRRGVASRMVQSAVRYVKSYWSSDVNRGASTIGLYVDERNHAAQSLYRKEGFVVVGRDEEKSNLLFMELNAIETPFE